MRNGFPRPDAVACVSGGPEIPELSGQVRFYQERGYVLVVADIAGLPRGNGSGFFALHIHEGGDCGGENFSHTKGHYDPAQMPHPEHAGDLPPLLLCHGGAYLAVRTDRFQVRDVVGRTVVIHSGPDDLHSQPAGNSGTKIACGVIHSVWDPAEMTCGRENCRVPRGAARVWRMKR